MIHLQGSYYKEHVKVLHFDNVEWEDLKGF
jgi:hypothetical protein